MSGSNKRFTPIQKAVNRWKVDNGYERRLQDFKIREQKIIEKEQKIQNLFNLVEDFAHEINEYNRRIRNFSSTLKDDLLIHTINKQTVKYIKGIESLTDLSSNRVKLFQYQIDENAIDMYDIQSIDLYKIMEKLYKSINDSSPNNEWRPVEIRGKLSGLVRSKKVLFIGLYILLDNALKYTSRDKKIYVDFKETQKEIKLSVENWGPVIDKEEQSRIFERGFRGKNAKNMRPNHGSGIGLHTASEIFEVCGVEVKTIFGQNTIRYNNLPYSQFIIELTFKNLVKRPNFIKL